MIWFSLEFAEQERAAAAMESLLKEYDVTGEVALRPLSSGRWRLDVSSEKRLRDSTIEKLGGRRLDGSG